MIYAYYRVSTDKQDYENQKGGVVAYCQRSGFKIDKEVKDEPERRYVPGSMTTRRAPLFDAARKHSTNALVSSVTPSPTGENVERLITADARRRRFIAQTFYSSLRVLDDGLPPPR